MKDPLLIFGSVLAFGMANLTGMQSIHDNEWNEPFTSKGLMWFIWLLISAAEAALFFAIN